MSHHKDLAELCSKSNQFFSLGLIQAKWFFNEYVFVRLKSGFR